MKNPQNIPEEAQTERPGFQPGLSDTFYTENNFKFLTDATH
jgi:hypothetical protein